MYSSWFLQELEDIKMSGLKSFRDIQIDEANILIWTGLIVPVSAGLQQNLHKYSRFQKPMRNSSVRRKTHRTTKAPFALK